MEYRKLPHIEETISILGLGTSPIGMVGISWPMTTMTSWKRKQVTVLGAVTVINAAPSRFLR